MCEGVLYVWAVLSVVRVSRDTLELPLWNFTKQCIHYYSAVLYGHIKANFTLTEIHIAEYTVTLMKQCRGVGAARAGTAYSQRTSLAGCN